MAVTERTAGMAEENNTPPEGETPTDTSDDTAGLKSALEKEREARKAAEKAAKENKSAAQKLAELEESQKTEQQKLADQLASVTTERDQAAADALRYRVALSKGLPVDLIDRLCGDNEDELAADADKLLELVVPKDDGGNRPGPRPDLSQGAQGGAGTSTAQQFAAAIGGEFST